MHCSETSPYSHSYSQLRLRQALAVEAHPVDALTELLGLPARDADPDLARAVRGVGGKQPQQQELRRPLPAASATYVQEWGRLCSLNLSAP